MALNFANNNSLSAITSLPASISGGALTLLQTQTASSSATISFTSNIDSTYDAYMFKFYDIHPSNESFYFTFQGSTDGGSNYGVTTTTTFFRAYHNESGSDSDLGYRTARDLAQSTSFINLTESTGNDDDQSCVGTLTIYNLSSSTFVKNWFCQSHTYHNNDFSMQVNSAGYLNTTSPINAIQFKMSSNNIDTGVIKLYGIS